jgi:hypothetical protein
VSDVDGGYHRGATTAGTVLNIVRLPALSTDIPSRTA